MNEDGVVALLICGVMIFLFFAGTCAGSDYAYTMMCKKDLLPLQTTLADSLEIAQKYNECEWWTKE